MEHQDWKEIKWEKNTAPSKMIHPKKSNHEMHQIKLDKSDDIVVIKNVDKHLSQKCIEARRVLGITRKQLAQRLSISENFINDFEMSKKKPEDKVMNKIINFIDKTLKS